MCCKPWSRELADPKAYRTWHGSSIALLGVEGSRNSMVMVGFG